MAKLIVGDKEYDVSMASLTIGDMRVVKKYTGVSGSALLELDDLDADLSAALIHVAFMRENPDLTFEEIEKMVNDVTMMSLDFTADDEAAVLPLSEASPDDEQPSSGESGSESSVTSPENVSHLSTGLRVSATGSISDQQTSQG